jgi:prophage DNA circulation protein
MAADRQTVLSWLADLAATIIQDADDLSDVTARISAAPGLDASGFAAEALALMRIVAESVTVAADFDRISVPASVAGETRNAIAIMVSMGLAIAGCRAEWVSRPMARSARSRVSAAGDDGAAAADTLGGDGADLYAWLTAVTAVSCRLLSDIAANAAPVIRVRTGISMPSTVLAYQLYGDAKRAGGLVDLAGSSTPMVMPTLFDALAS